jgi:hypothetical protein
MASASFRQDSDGIAHNDTVAKTQHPIRPQGGQMQPILNTDGTAVAGNTPTPGKE